MEAGRPVSLLKRGIDDLKETWPGEPDRFQEIHVDSFLLWCVKRNASDITFQTSRTVYSEIYGVLYPATNRSIDGADMAAVVSRIYGAEALPILAGGKDIDLSYEIMIDRTHRTRFRVNMTAILADGRDGIQITMRVLPSSPPTMKTLKVDSEILKYWKPRQGIVLVTGPT
ncbi:MAG: ATPase, partial [Alphaproteobacteria bacterium]|nr:ATPase [Alphaproteobacteria bacterium]